VADDGSTNEMTWEDLDKEIMSKLSPGANIAIISNTILSPTTKRAIADFQIKYPNAKLVVYDQGTCSAILDANEANLVDRVIATFHFNKADVIVSFSTDFLSTWISPVEYAAQYAAKRKIKNDQDAAMSHHIQVETGVTMTG